MSLKDKILPFQNLSTLEYSQKVQEIIDNETNFGYDNKHDILKDLNDEIEELKIELDKHTKQNDNTTRIFEELGDVLFVLGNLSNRYNINSSDALKYSVDEFIRRMIYCEQHYEGNLKTAPMATMLKLWKDAKKNK